MGDYHHLGCTLLRALELSLFNGVQYGPVISQLHPRQQRDQLVANTSKAFLEMKCPASLLELAAGALISPHLLAHCLLMQLILVSFLPVPVVGITASRRWYSMRPDTTLSGGKNGLRNPKYIVLNYSSNVVFLLFRFHFGKGFPGDVYLWLLPHFCHTFLSSRLWINAKT